MTRDLKQQLSQVALRIARSVFGYSIKMEKVTLLDEGMEQFTSLIGKVAEQKSIEVCKKVQEATKEGFAEFAKDMEELKKRVKDLEGLTPEVVEEITDEIPQY